jgi:uncharacterized membrane protein
MMASRRLLLHSAVAGVVALGIGQAAQAQDAKGAKEKCYGIAKAGQNDCANLSGTHSCAGQAKADMSPEDWKYVAKGSCQKMGGKTADEAKAAMAPKK